MSSTRTGLETALAANPDDAAIHAAYADLLMEEGDPRGEYIQLQLALEDRNQPADRLRAMEQRAYSLRKQHERDWLGPLGRFVDEWSPFTDELNLSPYWKRGWVSNLRVEHLTRDVLQAICEAPILQLLEEFHVREPARGLTEARHFAPLFASMRRRPLAVLHFGDGPGDELVDVLIESGILPRLRKLTLWGCRLTDDGAQLLARQLRPGQLEVLDLYDNHISPIGEEALAGLGYSDIGEQFGYFEDGGEIPF